MTPRNTQRFGPAVFIVAMAASARIGPFIADYSQRRAMLLALVGATCGVGLSGAACVLQTRGNKDRQATLLWMPLWILCVLILSALPLLAVRSLQGLSPTALGRIEAVAVVRSDGEQLATLDGYQATLQVDGKRLRAMGRGRSGSVLAHVSSGSKVRVRGIVEEWKGDIPAWAVSRHLAARMTVSEIQVLDGGAWWWRFANWTRARMVDGGSALPPNQRALYMGFLLGDDRGQTPAVTDDFRAAGLSHLLVVSGQNVAFLLVAAEPVLRRLPLRARAVGALLVIGVFALLTRFEPSVLRASVMASLTVLARSTERPQDPLRILAGAVALLLLVDPLLAWSLGFALSVCATAGLALWSQPLARRLPGPAWLGQPLAATIAAQAGTFPLLVGLGGLSPFTIVANLLALPVAEPAMIWGVCVGLPAGLLGDNAAVILHLPTRVFVTWIGGVSWVTAQIVRQLPVPWWWPVLLMAGWVLSERVLARWYVHKLHGRVAVAALTAVLVVGVSVTKATGSSRALAPHPLGRTTSALFSHSGVHVVSFRVGSSPTAVLAELRAQSVRRVALVVVHKDSRLVWNQLFPVLARYPAPVAVCGWGGTTDTIPIIGLSPGDTVMVSTGSSAPYHPGNGLHHQPWLTVSCRGPTTVITAGATRSPRR
jgi:competence protein ComEC